MFNIPLYRPKKLLLAFEYGVMLSQVAQKQGVELTPEIVERAERMIYSEFTRNDDQFLATRAVPNILSVFELDTTK